MTENLPGHAEYERAIGSDETPPPSAKPADDAQRDED